MENRDVVILGAGPAGYAAAIRTAQLGGRATIIEKEMFGGTCLNRGCVPVRVLTRAVELLETAARARDYGVVFKEVSVDFAKLMNRKNVAVKTLVAGVRMLLTGNQVEILEGVAKLTAPGEVVVSGADGNATTLHARNIIIASGSRCGRLPAEGGERVLDTATVLELQEVPRSIAIVGAGFVGVSFATIFAHMGTKVTLIDSKAGMLTGMDAEIVGMYERELKKSKVGYLPQTALGQCIRKPDGDLDIIVEGGGQEARLGVQYLLMAEDRVPNIEGIGVEAIGMRTTDRGGIAVDRQMKTNVPGVYAAGDITMENMWTPVAYREGIVAAENAMGRTSYVNHSGIPLWTNTLPPLAAVGLTEELAKAAGQEIKVGRFWFAGNGMATILGQRSGLIKLITEAKYGQVLGVHIIGPNAAELINQGTLALKLEVTPEEIGNVFYTHPSLSEAFWEAAKDVRGEAIHFLSADK
ncbi:MAG: dihydrolipoyl dehydrogenase [Syntrophorhabdaceae bacterium]